MAVENDIVLIYFEEKPLVFARIEEILPDVKPNWYHVKLLMLQVPLQLATWILRDVYINGEPFTMDGRKMRLELIQNPEKEKPSKRDHAPAPKAGGKKSNDAKVISLADAKKK
jgi:hypothetical protein